MSESGQAIRGHILIADFANVDAASKVNILGGNLSFLGTGPDGMTAPVTVYAILISPSALDEPVAVEIVLVDASGHPVLMPTQDGKTQALRVAQNIEFQAPTLPGILIPKGSVETSSQMILNFPNGLPLQSGSSYTWRLQVDHDVIASAAFYIPQPPAAPVIG